MEKEKLTTEEETYIDGKSIITIERIYTTEKGSIDGLISYLLSLMEQLHKGGEKDEKG